MAKPLRLPFLFLVVAVGMFVAVTWFVHSWQTADQAQPAVSAPATAVTPALSLLGGKIMVTDVTSASREFMDAYHTVHLTAEQEAIKKVALEPMPASCCANSTAYTCCCPCNLSKTIWGLSNYAIAKHGADAKQLRAAVDAWMGFINPDGFRGNACYQGGCEGSIS